MATVDSICPECGNAFVTNTWRPAKYCGEACYQVARKPKARNCVNCGCFFCAVKPIRRNDGIRYIAYDAGKTCSEGCERLWYRNNEARKEKISAAFTGHLHPNWQGGKARINSISRRGSGWQKQRRRALERDGWKCRDCGIMEEDCQARYGRGLDVDHIEPFHNFTSHSTANHLGNLASRCASCHRKAEAKRTNVQMVLPFTERGGHKGYSHGASHPKAKLTEAEVLTIKRRLDAGETGASLAREFGVSTTVISAIRKGKIWKHLFPSSR